VRNVKNRRAPCFIPSILSSPFFYFSFPFSGILSSTVRGHGLAQAFPITHALRLAQPLYQNLVGAAAPLTPPLFGRSKNTLN